MTAGYSVIRWAKAVPVVRRSDGKADRVAHHVLLVLATFANKAGIARPSLSTVADETYLTEGTVHKAVQRLETAGLLTMSGSWGTTVVWQLNLSRRRGPEAELEAAQRAERTRHQTAARVRRHRERQLATAAEAMRGDGSAHEGVTAPECVGNGPADRDVTRCESVGNAAADRDVTASERDVTPSQVDVTVSESHVTVPTPLHAQVRGGVTTNELPIELPKELTTLAAAPRESETTSADVIALPTLAGLSTQDTSGEDPAFGRFWAAYPRKVAKGQARRAWAKALTTNVDPEEVISGAAAYAAARDGQDPRYTAHPATWLSGERWTDQPPPMFAPTGTGGWTPYANPDDESVYDQPLLAPQER
ncbi:helix-turn-helix domain-containing protein [Amycolatopsis sp. NPDC059657]|uniref:helix-turn-helix domain-containing protein n=1 Tax=Amycolatopsis sp. NPDC059657 TaxID=3346899 RepID=UPI00366C309A